MSTKNGKANIKSRGPAVESVLATEALQELYLNPLMIDEGLKTELREQNFEWRFINIKQYREMGFHRSYWKPYKRKTQGPNDSFFETDPDGYIKRGDLVLAVKPKQHAELHRAKLKMLNALQANPNKVKADEMRALAKDAGIEVKVHEGYTDKGEREPTED